MKVILVLSGKGGVGKSSVSVQLALSLLLSGHSVGLLDVDLCGPSVPKMLGLSNRKVHQSALGWEPVYFAQKLPVMSIAFLLPHEDDSVVWRGPKKNSMIKQFCQNVNWGNELEYLIVDTPPGTSDEHLALVENFPEAEAILVTTPQMVALQDVQKEITFCRTTGIRIRGLIENMSGYACPHCAHCTNIFSSGGGRELAERNGLKLLAVLPIEAKVTRMLDGRVKGNEEEVEEKLIEEFKGTQLYSIFQSIILENFSDNPSPE